MICSGEFGGLHFFNAGNLVSRGEFIHQRRVMKCWVLIYVLSGRLDISSGGICRSVASGEWLFLKPGEEHFGTAPSEGGAFLSVGAFLAGNAVLRRRKRRGLHAAGVRQGFLAEDRRDIPAACGLLPQEHVYHAHGGMRPGNAADRTHPGAPGFLRTLPAAQTNSFMFPVRLVW